MNLFDYTGNKKIELVTAKGRAIDNYQVFEFSAYERNKFKDYTSVRFPNTIFKCSPSPEYNCHGMSFASRRTNIDKSNDIRIILNDDCYEKIDEKQTMIGDIVLYVSEGDGDIMHSGTIVFAEHKSGDLSHIKVISKWGKYREAIHPVNETDYNKLSSYRLEYYRLTHTHYEV